MHCYQFVSAANFRNCVANAGPKGVNIFVTDTTFIVKIFPNFSYQNIKYEHS